jgi:hypothetical protein
MCETACAADMRLALGSKPCLVGSTENIIIFNLAPDINECGSCNDTVSFCDSYRLRTLKNIWETVVDYQSGGWRRIFVIRHIWKFFGNDVLKNGLLHVPGGSSFIIHDTSERWDAAGAIKASNGPVIDSQIGAFQIFRSSFPAAHGKPADNHQAIGKINQSYIRDSDIAKQIRKEVGYVFFGAACAVFIGLCLMCLHDDRGRVSDAVCDISGGISDSSWDVRWCQLERHSLHCSFRRMELDTMRYGTKADKGKKRHSQVQSKAQIWPLESKDFSTSIDRRSKNVRVLPIIIAELKGEREITKWASLSTNPRSMV